MRLKKALRFIILTLLSVIIISCTISIFLSYNGLEVTEYRVCSEKIHSDISVVVLSDLHDSRFGKDNRRLIDKVSDCKPDLILTVGDMINDSSEDFSQLTSLYHQLSEIAPTYCSLGNHEQSNAHYDEIKTILSDNSAGLLDCNYIDLEVNGNKIRLGGLSRYFRWDEPANGFIRDFIATDCYTLLMYHHPEHYIWGIEQYRIDLSVSGHTHGGQVIIPFKGGLYAPEQEYFPELDYGNFHQSTGEMIISRGLGSSPQPLPRFNNIPEIVHITISAEDTNE